MQIEANKGGTQELGWVGDGAAYRGLVGEQTGTQGRAASILFPHVKFEMLRGHLSGNVSK